MARIRSIKPEFFTSLAVASLPLEARLTFVGLWTHVDDEGRAVDDARLIKAALWPLDDRVASDVEADLKLLSEASLIVRYRFGERSFLAVRNWGEHQRINRPTLSKFPAPSEATEPPEPEPTRSPTSANSNLTEPSPQTHGRLSEGSRGERNREQGTGNREQPPALASLDAEPVIDAEIVDPPTFPVTLFVVPDPPGTDIAAPEPTNAGQINRQWIDYCTGNGLKLTTTAIKRYGRHIKDALAQGFTVELVKHALAEMLRDRVVSRPALFENYLVRVQQGPERPPQRMTRAQETAERLAPTGMSPEEHLRHTLTRLA